MNVINENDIIIYVDSSTYFNKSIKKIIDFINNNSILCFKHGNSNEEKNHNQSIWTKMNAVKYFNYMNVSYYNLLIIFSIKLN